MKTRTTRVVIGLLRCTALGAATGCRGSLGLLAPGLATDRRWLTVTAAVASELVFDKVPGVPARTQPPGLIARTVSAGTGAYKLAKRFDVPLVPGIAASVVGSVAATYGGVKWRAAANGRMPDWSAAVIEDTAAVSAAYVAVRPIGRL